MSMLTLGILSRIALLITICQIISCDGNVPSTLRQVHLVFRHGDRTPTGTFPTDPYQEDAWPQGFGQLTQVGMVQEGQLGRLIRKLYNGFLNETYFNDEIYVRSTDKDRTLMSAYTNLAGLYPPKGFQIWNEDIKWQPIPVHTVEYDKDNLLSLTDSTCEKVSQMVRNAYLSEEVLSLEERNKLLSESDSACQKYHDLLMALLQSDQVIALEKSEKDFLDMVRRETGLPNATFYEILEKVPNPLFCEKTNNMTLPDWVTDDVYKHLQDLKAYQSKLWFFNPEMQRLRGGVFLSEIVNHTDNHVSGKMEQKMYMYSAHDTTITGILISLDIWDGLLPPYASFLVFELHQDQMGTYFVRLRYKNDTLSSPSTKAMVLKIKGCTEDCQLTTFYKIIDPIVYRGDWFKECSMEGDSSNSHQERALVIAVVMLCIVLIILLTLAFTVGLLIRRRRNKELYSHL